MSKKGKDDAAGCLVIAGILVLLILLPLLPIILGVITIINWFKLQKKKKLFPNKTASDFWLNEQEKERFKEMSKNISIAKRNVKDAKEAGANENLKRNQDGSFSNKGYRGKEINNIIYKNESYLDDNVWEIDMLAIKPIYDWKRMRNIYGNYIASSYTILIWILAFYITFSQYFKKPLIALSEIYSHYIYGTTKYIILKDDWEKNLLFVLAITAVITLIGYFIMRYIGKAMFSKKYPKPEKVTYQNVDIYKKPLNTSQ
jgi:hypothetical protein